MDDEITQVVVKEAVYKSLDQQGFDTLQYLAEPVAGYGTYGSYSGRVIHLTDEYGPVVCGTFEVLVRQGEYFPEVWECQVTVTGDQEPPRTALLSMLAKA